MSGPTQSFWQERFEKQETPWDRGGPNPQLLRWLENGELSPCRILVPGCGKGWEVLELAQRGFDVVGVDYTQAAVEHTRALLASQGAFAQVVEADVLSYHPNTKFDAIYEQTCLCAIHPDHWKDYAEQIWHWLVPGGSLWVMFMQSVRPAATEEGRIEGPPYHCDINAMRAMFPLSRWQWPTPPYTRVPHTHLTYELALQLVKRS